jgi:CRP-like cAMP-binding protein
MLQLASKMASFDVLRAYLEARASISGDEFAFMREHFIPTRLPAGEFLQRAGDVSRHAAFVASGCLRSYVIDADGKEHVVHFAPETWWLADTASLMTGNPSQYFVDAVEDSDLLLIDPSSHQLLVERVPGYAAAFRTGLQRHAAAKDQRIVTALTTTARERYLEFIERYPSLAQRVPQWMVASYLGVSPETISRIRKGLSRR